MVGLDLKYDLDKTLEPLMKESYIYFEIYNESMPYRRFFVKHKGSPIELSIPKLIRTLEEIPSSTIEHSQRLAHIHILTIDSEHWTRHIAFRDYIRAFPEVKKGYQQLKENLSKQEWIDGNEYNMAKNNFIKFEEKKALDWYENNCQIQK